MTPSEPRAQAEPSRTALPGAIIEQRTRWEIERIEGDQVYIMDEGKKGLQKPIPIPMGELVAKGIVDPPVQLTVQPSVTGLAGRAIACDCETGGFSPETNALLTVGLVEFDLSDGSILGELEVRVKPRFEDGLTISGGAVATHGIDWAAVRNHEPERNGLGKVYNWLKERHGLTVWDHSSNSFDRRFIEAALRRHTAKEFPWSEWRCTQELKATFPKGTKWKLNDLAMRYALPIGAAHDALADARTLARIMPRLLKEAGEIRQGSL